MAHRIRIFSRPHINADGKESKSKKDWFFRDRGRSTTFESPPFSTEKQTASAIEEYRAMLVVRHQQTHPNDKRGMKSFSDERKK